jgi:anti-anti-sigma regulatory factor
MIKISGNTIILPRETQIDDIQVLYDLYHRLENLDDITVDLSRTDVIHTSVIGFLIFLKNDLSKRGKGLLIISSKKVKKIFDMLKIEEYLSADKSA